MKVPLAWLQLTREKMRLLIALAGIGFADLLMFMQLGFKTALFNSAIAIHERFQGDLVLVSPRSEFLGQMVEFPRTRLYQARGFEGVESVSYLYIAPGSWKNPVNPSYNRSLFIFGFDPARPVFDIPEVNEQLDKIKLPDVFLFDEASRAEFGPVAELFKQGKTVTTELSERRIKIGGLFKLGVSFTADGNVITSDLNFIRVTKRSLEKIDIGFINLKPGADPQIVLENIQKKLPNDVKVLTLKGFMEMEKHYWETSTAIGFIFGLGVGMGFIVGIVIVYQILYTDVADHLPEYATLKAMGYTDLYLLNVVFQEAILLSVLGYIPGFIISMGLYNVAKSGTGLPMIMTLDLALTVMILTIVMCFISGAIAVRKLQAADPADIF
ncbi:ABC transporter permease DevC [Argonema antarcticum]|uniref:ABC transporter permease DevC n=1 Tax=Argonema antarcticum TaxID=2942763 RepID=UPI0020117751|nr:ABC transporter permease DevC [Argonema antarcticum]MCL1469519.1 ABC transporter permease DevC [Argonema antarcticum A004/B2]